THARFRGHRRLESVVHVHGFSLASQTCLPLDQCSSPLADSSTVRSMGSSRRARRRCEPQLRPATWIAAVVTRGAAAAACHKHRTDLAPGTSRCPVLVRLYGWQGIAAPWASARAPYEATPPEPCAHCAGYWSKRRSRVARSWQALRSQDARRVARSVAT